jgi:hypothetical protein
MAIGSRNASLRYFITRSGLLLLQEGDDIVYGWTDEPGAKPLGRLSDDAMNKNVKDWVWRGIL